MWQIIHEYCIRECACFTTCVRSAQRTLGTAHEARGACGGLSRPGRPTADRAPSAATAAKRADQ
eukprot:4314950-Pleurochrysis_carterae.AAC.5